MNPTGGENGVRSQSSKANAHGPEGRSRDSVLLVPVSQPGRGTVANNLRKLGQGLLRSGERMAARSATTTARREPWSGGPSDRDSGRSGTCVTSSLAGKRKLLSTVAHKSATGSHTWPSVAAD
jgi:hypothetical protein